MITPRPRVAPTLYRIYSDRIGDFDDPPYYEPGYWALDLYPLGGARVRGVLLDRIKRDGTARRYGRGNLDAIIDKRTRSGKISLEIEGRMFTFRLYGTSLARAMDEYRPPSVVDIINHNCFVFSE